MHGRDRNTIDPSTLASLQYWDGARPVLTDQEGGRGRGRMEVENEEEWCEAPKHLESARQESQLGWAPFPLVLDGGAGAAVL